MCSYKIDNEMCTQQEWKNLRFLMRFPHSSLPTGQTQMLCICSRGLFVCVLVCIVRGKKFPDTLVFVTSYYQMHTHTSCLQIFMKECRHYRKKIHINKSYMKANQVLDTKDVIIGWKEFFNNKELNGKIWS